MKYTFQPKNHLDAFDFFMQVPFYSLWDVFYKKNLELNFDEIKSIELNLKSPGSFKIFYSAKKLHGDISIKEKIEDYDFSNIEIKRVNKSFFTILLASMKFALKFTFSRYSPALWAIASSLIVVFIFWLLFVQNTYFNPQIVGNDFCDLNCVNGLWKKIMYSYMRMTSLGVGIMAMIYLCFFKAKKSSEASYCICMQSTSLTILVMLSFNLFKDLEKISTPRFQTQTQIVYKPHYFKMTAQRGIASQKGVDKVD